MYRTPVVINYATKDYQGFKQMMLDLIPVVAPSWTDLSDSDFGMVLLELQSYGLDVNSYYLDRAINENLLVSARTRRAILALSRFLGYELSLQRPAKVYLRFTKYDVDISKEVIIPKGSRISTDPQLGNIVYFETSETLIIPADMPYADVLAYHGITIPEYLIGYGLNKIGQHILLDYTDVLMDTLSLYTIENGVIKYWSKVDNFIESTAEDRHYRAYVDEDFYTHIIFGSGQSGTLVPNSVPIYATFRVGGGQLGSVGAHKLTYMTNYIANIETVDNPLASYDWADYERSDHAREVAPLMYAVGNRCVTPDDFKGVAMSISGVEKATIVETFNQTGDLYVYIVPSDYGVASEDLKAEVKEKIESMMVVNNTLYVDGTTYVSYNLVMDVIIGANYSNSEKKAEIEADLINKLHSRYFEHGESLPIAYITSQVMQIEGVKNIPSITPSTDITCTATQLLKCGSVSVTVTGGVS